MIVGCRRSAGDRRRVVSEKALKWALIASALGLVSSMVYGLAAFGLV